jgi:hypothetical protein
MLIIGTRAPTNATSIGSKSEFGIAPNEDTNERREFSEVPRCYR